MEDRNYATSAGAQPASKPAEQINDDIERAVKRVDVMAEQLHNIATRMGGELPQPGPQETKDALRVTMGGILGNQQDGLAQLHSLLCRVDDQISRISSMV